MQCCKRYPLGVSETPSRQEPAFFEDEVVRFHMQFLSNELMEKNFLKIVEPYDVVEIGFVARKMELPEEEVGVTGGS